jgi:hypothetical protein
MKMRAKTAVILGFGTILLSGLVGQTSQATMIESGTAILADVNGASSGSETLTVNYFVSESSGIYTYAYVLNNPLGDVLLNPDGSLTSTPEVVDAFSIAFNASSAGAYVVGTQLGGAIDQDNGGGGLFWSFAAINPGTSSPALSFESDLAPILGNANALDANPPSPWSSIPFGQQLALPNVSDSTNTLALLAGIVLFLPLLSTMSQKAVLKLPPS